MCGIGVIGSGIHICPLDSSPPPPPPPPSRVAFSIDDLKSALSRRGPDSLGTKTLHLHPEASTPLLPYSDNKNAEFPNSPVVAELHFIGATLQLRGPNPVAQPFADSSGNILVYNGEIFGGIDVDSDCNDGEALMQALEGNSVPEVLSMIKGPWAVIYWQESLRTIWFGRDAFGRRSILVHWPSFQDSRFLLSSVSPFSSLDQSSGFEVANGTNLNFWEELTCGIYSLSMDANKLNGCVVGEVRKHEWANKNLVELIKWERACVKPTLEELHSCGCKTLVRQNDLYLVPLEAGPDGTSVSSPAHHVLAALRKSVMVRTSSYKNFQEVRFGNQQEDFVPVAVLFSGGLDSMILAALLDECSDPCYGIDLLNVSFDGESAPDRISAKSGLQELKRIAPLRRWKLVEINADLCNLTLELSHVTTLINPASTYMDLNIGIALWLAASGDGWVSEATSNSGDENNQRIKYKSEARIVLVGAGADEQCAGYGRHRTKYRNGSWDGLHEEMKLDMQRIWKRNMGRDDRCIADNGKEARFPFLDEDVIRTLLDIPLWKVANLDQPSGIGDKKILREVAGLLGLHEAAVLPKRAIQFGSRVARESNRKNFGSNRAANLASAGSANINNIKVQSSSFSVMSDWKRERTALHNAKSG